MNHAYKYISAIMVGLGSVTATATDLSVTIQNDFKKPVFVELYENLDDMLALDVEAMRPEWEWQVKLNKGESKIQTKAVNSPGTYQISAYLKTRKNPLGKPYNFELAADDSAVNIEIAITDAGVVVKNGPAAIISAPKKLDTKNDSNELYAVKMHKAAGAKKSR